MIITKTPYRVSFFGGGTDHPEWFLESGGSVLSTTIKHYCYITCRHLPKFFDHKHRFVYSEIESVSNVLDIKHPAIKGVLSWLNWQDGIEMHHDGDLPARSGLGSSSAFTIGLLNALYAMQGLRKSKHDLAKDAIHIEKNVIGEAVGLQDQIAVSYGGFNRIDFLRNGEFVVNPVILKVERLKEFESKWLMFYTGQSRIEESIEKEKIINLQSKKAELRAIQASVEEALTILNHPTRSLDEIGKLMDEVWQQKKALSKSVSSKFIDDIYSAALRAGALGGKILGAGGGGFLLFYVPIKSRESVRMALTSLLEVPFALDSEGSSISFYQP
jgi:D-glycero-alpha-D-manno-heptose-7-phosphate kinase